MTDAVQSAKEASLVDHKWASSAWVGLVLHNSVNRITMYTSWHWQGSLWELKGSEVRGRAHHGRSWTSRSHWPPPPR
ncbi:hypothetical protein HaLaN_21371, partial [Haematococcus lacustris]